MPAQKLKLPPGIQKDGPAYARAGTWINCNLMRWYNGVLTTIGGWQKKLSPSKSVALQAVLTAGEIIRSGITATDLFSEITLYFGSNKEIYHVIPDGTVSKVTPTAFVAQLPDAIKSTGYGLGMYGTQAYGTARAASLSSPPIVFSWGFTLWGEDVIACARGVAGQHLYIMTPGAAKFVPMPASPTGTYGVLVTSERIVMTIGTDADQRIVNWTDREDNTDWTPTTINMAGFYRLTGKGRLLAIRQIQAQILIIGDNEVFVGQFTGSPYVYGFNRIGENCGCISPLCVVGDGDVCYWFGNNVFWKYDGTLTPLPCSMLDFFLKDSSESQRSKMNAMTNASFSEIWWLYQSNDSTDCDSYLIYNYAMNIWYHGKLARTYGLDAVPLRYITMCGADGFIYDHELPGAGYSGVVPFIVSGPLETEDGDRLMGMSYVYPDDTATTNLLMEVEVRSLPKDPPIRTEVFTLTDPTSTTGILGRDLRLKFEHPNSNEMWELGDVRVVPINAPTGRR